MKQFLSFVRKEFIHILRDPRSLLILLVMPQIMVMLPGYVIKNEVRDIRVAIIDHSHDDLTHHIAQRLAVNEYFVFQGYLQTEAEADDLFSRGKVDLVVVFGPNLSGRLRHGADACVQILSDGSEPNQASVRVAYAQQVVAGLVAEVAGSSGGNASTKSPITTSSRLLFNPQQRSEVNFVPGVVGMVLLLICCMMTSIAIVREREMGTMEILLASPLPAIDIVLAKLVPYLVISLIDLFSILCIAVFLMHVPMAGSLMLYVAAALIYIFASLMIGLFISTCVQTQLAAMLLSILLIVPTIYLSGMVFSIESMPRAAQLISHVVPAKWFIAASRKIMIEGVGWRYVAHEMLALLAEATVFLLLSWRMFKTRLE